MNPAPPKRDLVNRFNALALADKKHGEKPLPDLPQTSTLFGGFSPNRLALNVGHRQPPSAHNRNGRTKRPPEAQKALPQLPSSQTPTPKIKKTSLTMQYALKFLGRDSPTKLVLSPPLVLDPPHLDPVVPLKEASRLPLSNVPRPRPAVAPSKPRARSVSLSSTSSSPGTAQCSSMTKAGKQCSRQVKLPATHSHLDPTPVLYCYQHKEMMVTGQQTGFYVRKLAGPDRFVEFSHYIPKYLRIDTQLALRVEMEKTPAQADQPGYIYTFEIRDPKRPNVIQLKVGRAINLNKRLDQWDKQCGSKVQIPRGWWPGTVGDDDGTGGSLLKGNIKAGNPGPFCHRVERLVHIELADLSLNTPYLDPAWPDNICDPATTTPKKTTSKKTTCLDCGVIHREIFTFPRPKTGRYKGQEWDLIVKPVIEKWGKFVKEYYT